MTNHRVPLELLTPARRQQLLDWPLDRRRHESEKCLQPAAHNLRITFVAINKSGTTTATVAIRTFHKLPAVNWMQHAEQYPDHKVVANWRDPYLRCESTYRWAIKCFGEPMPGVMPDPRTQSFASWVEELCDVDTPKDWYDSHIQSQTYLCSSPTGKLPDINLAWDWPRLWQMFRIPHKEGDREIRNVSEHAPTEWGPTTRAQFERVYADDIEFWNKLNEGK